MILWVYFLRAPVVKITLCLTTQLASHHWSVRVKPQTEKSENPRDWKILKIRGKWNYLKEAEQLIVFSCWTMWSPTHVQVLGNYAGSCRDENVCWFVICVRAGFFPLCDGGGRKVILWMIIQSYCIHLFIHQSLN